MPLKKIMCCCVSGLGSSFIVEMNVKKVLSNLGLKDITVEHGTISDTIPGSADLFICSADMAEQCASAGDVLPLVNLASTEELEKKLREYLKIDK